MLFTDTQMEEFRVKTMAFAKECGESDMNSWKEHLVEYTFTIYEMFIDTIDEYDYYTMEPLRLKMMAFAERGGKSNMNSWEEHLVDYTQVLYVMVLKTFQNNI